MKIYIGYEHYDDKKTLHNGFYHQFKDDFDIEEVDIHEHNNYYIFPINALYANTDVLEKYSFFGNKIPGTTCPSIGCCYDVNQTSEIKIQVTFYQWIQTKQSLYGYPRRVKY